MLRRGRSSPGARGRTTPARPCLSPQSQRPPIYIHACAYTHVQVHVHLSACADTSLLSAQTQSAPLCSAISVVQNMDTAMATMIGGSDVPNAQSGTSAAMSGYKIQHSSLERVQGDSTPKSLPAALKLIEQITRPMTAVEAVMGSPAMAYGVAAETAEEAFTEDADKSNSEGGSNTINLGDMDFQQLRAMHNQI